MNQLPPKAPTNKPKAKFPFPPKGALPTKPGAKPAVNLKDSMARRLQK